MTALPKTPELLAVAERVVWFKPPAEALADPIHFLAYVMTYRRAPAPPLPVRRLI
jgi:hypothetical protein